MVLLGHLPTSLIVSVSNLSIRSAMAPPACMERTIMSSGLKPCEVVLIQCSISMGMGRTRVGGVLPCVVLKLSSQTKVETSHGVYSGVCGPHCREYFPHG